MWPLGPGPCAADRRTPGTPRGDSPAPCRPTCWRVWACRTSGRTRPRRSTWHATGRSVVVATGTASGKSLCFQVPIAEAAAGAGAARHRPAGLSHQGPGPRSAAGIRRAGISPGRRRGVRRRRRPGGAGLDPPACHRGADEPGDAAQRDPPAPRSVGNVPGPLALRRRGRAARLPGDLREPRRSRAAPTPPPGAPLRRRSHLRVLLGHHRPAGRAGVGPVRPPGRGRGGRRLASGRAAGGGVEPTADSTS